MKRKLLILLLAFSLITTNTFASGSDIKVIVNGNILKFDQSPIIRNNRTLIPIREIFEALGANIQWFPESQKVLASKDGRDISLFIGSNIMYLDSITSVELDVPAEIINNKTYIPLRAVSEAFDASVEWNESTKTATIVSNSSGLKISKVTESYEVKSNDGKVIMDIKYNYPLIDNPNNETIIDEFNQNYKIIAEKFIEENKNGDLAKEATEFYNDALKEDFEFHPYSLEETFDITYNRNKIVSILSTSYSYTGGAHPNHLQSNVIYDLTTNKKLELTDILNKTENEIKQIFIDGFSKMVDNEPDKYFKEAKETISNNTNEIDKINFYLSNNGLVFFFEVYEIAPYAAGNPSFSIPFENNEDLFNEKFIAQ